MQLKDYYKILEIEPSATLPEIKKAYRRLAQQYHPDKNSNEQYSRSYFAEIKEAYEVLTNPVKKNDYLQQRWYQQSLGKKEFQSHPVTPVALLKQFIEFDKYVSQLDKFRMNKEEIYQYTDKLLSEENIAVLKNFNEQSINKEITERTLRIASHFDLTHAKIIAGKLHDLNNEEPETIQQVNLFLQQLREKARWEKYKLILILLITITVSVLIYLVSR